MPGVENWSSRVAAIDVEVIGERADVVAGAKCVIIQIGTSPDR